MQIHVPIMNLIEEARESVVISLIMVINTQDNRTTKMDTTRSEVSMRGMTRTMVQKRKMLEMEVKKFAIDVAEEDIGHYLRTDKQLVDLYQASKKEDGKIETNLVDGLNHVDLNNLNVFNFFEAQKGKSIK